MSYDNEQFIPSRHRSEKVASGRIDITQPPGHAWVPSDIFHMRCLCGAARTGPTSDRLPTPEYHAHIQRVFRPG